MGQSGGRVRWVVAVAAVALIGACSSDEGSGDAVTRTSRPARPVTVHARRGPGTKVADGIVVEAGSSLVGSALPVVEQYVDDPSVIGWQAVIAVDGDPIDVWDAYIDELDLADRAGARRACVVRGPVDEDGRDQPSERFLSEPWLDEEVQLACHARIGSATASLVSGIVGCVRPNLGDDPCDPRHGSVLYLRSTTSLDPEEPAGEELGTDDLRDARTATIRIERNEQDVPLIDVPGGPIVRPQLPKVDLTELPVAGERIDGGIDYYLGTDDYVAPPSILPEGASSLISPAMLLDCNSGLVALVSVPGTPIEALTSFDADAPGTDSTVHEGAAEGRPWASRSFDSAGGFKLGLTAVEQSEGRSFVLATECGD